MKTNLLSVFVPLLLLLSRCRAVNRCGRSYSDAASKCRKCPRGIDSECGSGETCYAGLSDCTPGGSGGGDGGENRCGKTYSDAQQKCKKCPRGLDGECGAGETCYAKVPACKSSPPRPPSGPTENRCGKTYSDAVKKCKKCPRGVDGECGAGETCYAKVPVCKRVPPAPRPPATPAPKPPTPDPKLPPSTPTPDPPTDCGDTAGDTYETLSCAQLENAQTIIDVGKDNDIPKYGWVVALATAMQESRLRNLGEDVSDRDSRGLFQQRPSVEWCSYDANECQDPVLASEAFYGVSDHTNNPGLLQIDGWQDMSVAEAAQAVQVSAYPDAYAQWEDLARQLVADLGGDGGSDPPAPDPPTPGPPAPDPPTPSGVENRCGSSYSDAEGKCSKCPGGLDGECAAGETCFAAVPACGGGGGGGGDDGGDGGPPSDDDDNECAAENPYGIADKNACGSGEFTWNPITEHMVDALKCFDESLGDACGTYGSASGDHPCNAADCEPGAIGRCPTQAELDQGWRAAKWLRDHAVALKVQYVIFDAKIWNVDRADEGWRQYCYDGTCYSQGACTTAGRVVTDGHYDHVHVSMKSP